MLYEIGHVLEYAYASPVSLGPHTVRLLPRSDAAQRLTDLRWEVRPAPSHAVRNLDLDGNDVLRVCFDKPVSSLTVRIKSHVETLRKNPFDYLLARPSIPVEYGDESLSLAPYRGPVAQDPALDAFCRELRAEAQGNAGRFLFLLCERLYALFKKEVREEGDPLPPSESWSLKHGACRDLAVLFMDCCRRAGFAARFVSGYFDDDPPRKRKDLHAWAEVYVEGGGWRGFDPTAGLAAGDRHIAVAAGASPPGASPVQGTFGGGGSKLRYAVSVARLG